MKSVNIGGIPYDFYLVPDIIPGDTSDDDRVGEADNREFTIKIANFGPQEFVKQTFYHKILHAIAHVMCIPELDKLDDHTDTIIDRLALGLMLAMRSVGVKVSDHMEEEDA